MSSKMYIIFTVSIFVSYSIFAFMDIGHRAFASSLIYVSGRSVFIHWYMEHEK